MSWLEGIKQRRNILKKTDTVVTTLNGLKIVESLKDNTTRIVKNENCLTYVIDNHPDLHIAQILDYLYLGSIDVAGAFEVLKNSGITHILNVSSGKVEYFPNDFIYHHVLLLDIPEENIIVKFDECVPFMDAVKHGNGRLLVHCMAGISRSPSIIIAYLMRNDNMCFEEAFGKVKNSRDKINPNDGFKKQLKSIF